MSRIKENEEAIYKNNMMIVGEMIYKVLSREYIEGDEDRIGAYLSRNSDFKNFMTGNKNYE